VIRPRLVLADDHEEILQVEAALLKPHFDVVGVAHDGAALIAEVERLQPDVVILDVSMPQMGASKLCENWWIPVPTPSLSS